MHSRPGDNLPTPLLEHLLSVSLDSTRIVCTSNRRCNTKKLIGECRLNEARNPEHCGNTLFYRCRHREDLLIDVRPGAISPGGILDI